MSLLSATLTDTLRDLKLNQSQLAKAAGITQSQVNRACRGTPRVKVNTIHAIARALPDDHRGPVIAAWLKDQLETDLRDTIFISNNESLVHERPHDSFPEEFNQELRELLTWIGQEAVRKGAVLDMLRGLKVIGTPGGIS